MSGHRRDLRTHKKKSRPKVVRGNIKSRPKVVRGNSNSGRRGSRVRRRVSRCARCGQLVCQMPVSIAGQRHRVFRGGQDPVVPETAEQRIKRIEKEAKEEQERLVAEDDSDDDIWLDPVVSETAEQRIKRIEKEEKEEQERLVAAEYERQEDVKRAERMAARAAERAAEKAAERAAEQIANRAVAKKRRIRAEQNSKQCSDDTIEIMQPYFDLYKQWGYDIWGGTHTRYEAQTHGFYADADGNSVDFTAYQAVTDPLMRILGSIEHKSDIARIITDRIILTDRSTTSMPVFERNERASDTYTRVILRPYLNSGRVEGLLHDLSLLGRTHAFNGGNPCVYYAGMCAANILAFNQKQYRQVITNNEAIWRRFSG